MHFHSKSLHHSKFFHCIVVFMTFCNEFLGFNTTSSFNYRLLWACLKILVIMYNCKLDGWGCVFTMKVEMSIHKRTASKIKLQVSRATPDRFWNTTLLDFISGMHLSRESLYTFFHSSSLTCSSMNLMEASLSTPPSLTRLSFTKISSWILCRQQFQLLNKSLVLFTQKHIWNGKLTHWWSEFEMFNVRTYLYASSRIFLSKISLCVQHDYREGFFLKKNWNVDEWRMRPSLFQSHTSINSTIYFHSDIWNHKAIIGTANHMKLEIEIIKPLFSSLAQHSP